MSGQFSLFDSAEPVGRVTVEKAAVLSPCRLFRYRLTRRWGDGAPLLFVMLNPSTADAAEDDPTIRRCVGYGRREQASAIEVVNIFAFRSTNPGALAEAADPIGPENDRHILDAAATATRIIAAWGKAVPKARRDRPAAVLRLLKKAKETPIYCFGKPGEKPAARHPLYLLAEAPLEVLL